MPKTVSYPTQSRILLYETEGAEGDTLVYRFFSPKMDPSKDYRLVFYVVGPELTVQLFNLTDGGPPEQLTASDESLTDGWVGFRVRGATPAGTRDFWLDNFIAVGTTP